MPRKRRSKPLLLTDDERRTLDQWARRPTSAQRLALRSRMVLACAEGLTNRAVARRLRVSSNSVCKWRERFRTRRLEGLTDEPRPGAPRKVTDDQVVDIITRTLEALPAAPGEDVGRGPDCTAQVTGARRSGFRASFAAGALHRGVEGDATSGAEQF